MKIQLNNSSYLPMTEITKELFNSEFLSDIHFLIDGQVIYAHSMELMKRSVQFQKQFEHSLGGIKKLPVKDTNYKCFYQLIRFIYTDECDMVDDTIGLLKLATTYRVIKLENEILRILLKEEPSDNLEFFEYCVLNKYKLPYNCIKTMVANNLHNILRTERFLSLRQDTVETILKFDHIPEVISEVDIFEQLVRWIQRQSDQNGIALAQRRSHFNELLRLIRFPTMAAQEVFDCIFKNQELFSEEDYGPLLKQCALRSKCTDQIWIDTPRAKSDNNLRIIYKNGAPELVAKFSVSRESTLAGIKYGVCKDVWKHKIVLSGPNGDVLIFETSLAPTDSTYNFISLGDTIVLQSGVPYSIKILYHVYYWGKTEYEVMKICPVYVRNPEYHVFIDAPLDLVNLMKCDENILEIHFN